MPRKIKPADTYPTSFFAMVEKAELTGEHFLLVEGEGKEHSNMKIGLRTQLYCFLASIRKEGEAWEKEMKAWAERDQTKLSGKPMPGKTWAATHRDFAKSTSIRIEENGVRLFSKNKTKMAELVERSLGGFSKDDDVIRREADELAKRWLEKQPLAEVTEATMDMPVMYGSIRVSELPSDKEILTNENEKGKEK